jgi:arsenate reductase-like glutaredoxin family protein
MKRKFMKEKDVLEKFSVPVQQVRDYLAIVWDSSDNIPGIAGFGPKKAEDLLGKYGSLDAVYDHIVELSPKVQQTLIDQRGNAFLSQKLATIITDLEVPLRLTDADTLKYHISQSRYIDILRMYEFRSLLPRDEISMVKTLEKKKNKEVLSLKWLDELLEHIQMIGKCILATDKDTIVIGCGDDTFSIHTNLVESSGFISWLLQSEIQIYGYDLKEDYKRLLTKEKPLQKVSEGQGILF